MTDRELLDDVIAKLHEMEEQLGMAQLETTAQTLLATRIRHLTILAQYVRARLEKAQESGAFTPSKGDGETRRDA
jgi:hypothetical protein